MTRVLSNIFGAQEGAVNSVVDKTYEREASLFVSFAKYYLGDQMTKNERGWACGTHISI